MLQELKEIGFTKGEIKVYEALLDLGECTKTSLAKKSQVSPSNIYDITNRLIEKGIVSKIEKNGIAHFSPANPSRINDFLNNKKNEIDKEKNIFASLLPTLLIKFSKIKKEINAEVFQNWDGLKTVFEDLLEECHKGDINLVFGATKGEKVELADNFFLKYSKAREEKGILTKIIFNLDLKNRKERITSFLKSKKYDVKFLQQTTPAEIMIYRERVCIIILTEKPLVIRITSKEVSESFRQYFDLMWKIAKR